MNQQAEERELRSALDAAKLRAAPDRERLAALSEAAELPAKPATSAGFYGEDELQGILAMHEQVLDVVDSEPAVTEASVFDLHEIVKKEWRGKSRVKVSTWQCC